MPPSSTKPDFEKALADLEKIVEAMEDGELPLEDALKAFEKGVKLTRDCQKALQLAEQKVTQLTQGENGISQEVPFSLDD